MTFTKRNADNARRCRVPVVDRFRFTDGAADRFWGGGGGVDTRAQHGLFVAHGGQFESVTGTRARLRNDPARTPSCDYNIYIMYCALLLNDRRCFL